MKGTTNLKIGNKTLLDLVLEKEPTSYQLEKFADGRVRFEISNAGEIVANIVFPSEKHMAPLQRIFTGATYGLFLHETLLSEKARI